MLRALRWAEALSGGSELAMKLAISKEMFRHTVTAAVLEHLPRIAPVKTP